MAGSDDSRQRIEETRVLFVQTDRDTQVIRHAVAGDRPDDHAKAQQRFVHRRRWALEIDAQKVAAGTDVLDAELVETPVQLFHAFVVDSRLRRTNS